MPPYNTAIASSSSGSTATSVPGYIYITPPLKTFPGCEEYPQGLNFNLFYYNENWRLRVEDFIGSAGQRLIPYPRFLYPSRGWYKTHIAKCIAEKKDSDIRCFFCKAKLHGHNAQSIWVKHLREQHGIDPNPGENRQPTIKPKQKALKRSRAPLPQNADDDEYAPSSSASQILPQSKNLGITATKDRRIILPMPSRTSRTIIRSQTPPPTASRSPEPLLTPPQRTPILSANRMTPSRSPWRYGAVDIMLASLADASPQTSHCFPRKRKLSFSPVFETPSRRLRLFEEGDPDLENNVLFDLGQKMGWYKRLDLWPAFEVEEEEEEEEE